VEYILKGDIVTLDRNKNILKDSCIVIIGGTIKYVGSSDKLPTNYSHLTKIDVNGFVYPGLIDLHNHIPYNFLKLWPISKPFLDRYQWPRLERYKSEINLPTKLLALSNPVELVKYVEVKALMGGSTSIDGYAKFSSKYAAWLLRNIEMEPFGTLKPPIYQSVLKLSREEEFAATARKMASGNAFIYHLAEGTSPQLINELVDLESHGLLREKLVGIHCVAFGQDQWKKMGKNKAKLVWSPLSNLLLYGKTADVREAKRNGVLISIGSDWSPTGSKNILWELKVADLYNKNSLNGTFTDLELVEMITINPTRSVGFEDMLGSIRKGLVADLVVFEKKENDPYRNLINAIEADLKLVVINGRPKYGDLELLNNFGLSHVEKLSIGSVTKGIDISEPDVEFGDYTFTEVRNKLSQALANPERTSRELFNKLRSLRPGEEPLRLLVEGQEEEQQEQLMALRNSVSFARSHEDFFSSTFIGIKPMELDALTMSDDQDFFGTLSSNQNVPRYLDDLRLYLKEN
jgi:5-methylthioadenosine/S-adenosylhomocysteine deaminase